MANDFLGPERRREDLDLARWRGRIEERMDAVEADVRDLIATARTIERDVTTIGERLRTVQREVGEYRKEVARAAAQIDRGRESAVDDLKRSIATSHGDEAQRRITKFQVFAGAGLAFLVSMLSALVSLAISGHLG